MLDRLDIRSTGVCAAVAACAFACGVAQATQPYEWSNVEIVGGAHVPRVVLNTREPDLIHTWTDIEGAYRWNPSRSRWIPPLDWIGLHAGKLTSVERLVTDPVDPHSLHILVDTDNFADSKGALQRSGDRERSFHCTNLSFNAGDLPLRHMDGHWAIEPTAIGISLLLHGGSSAGPRVFDRAYIASSGRGIIYGDAAQVRTTSLTPHS